MLIVTLIKALRNLMLPGIWKLFFFCVVAYVISWTLVTAIITFIINASVGISGAEGFFFHIIGSLGGGIVAWFFFPLLFPILMSFFDDKIFEVIEREDYPQLPVAQPPFWPTILADVKFSLKAVALNVLCLPLYFIPPLWILVYFGMNGYLLGAQFFRMAAGRRMSAQDAKDLQHKASGSVFFAGVAIMVCSTIPLLNLAAPVLGIATMLHMVHLLNGTARVQVLPPQ
jgi:uncharacterized protein involved in cysteine biosynthesis